MNNKKQIAILIPTLNPDERLINLVNHLNNESVGKIIIINDGTKKENMYIFDKLENVTIYTHEVNKGKGAAIKTGISNVKKYFPDVCGIITADCDGQHSVEDIKKIKKEMIQYDEIVLGTRNFDSSNVPITSKIGNTFSSIYFKVFTGISLKDTQTGLRAIPKKYFEFCLEVEGQRYDYEMRFLEKVCERKYKIRTVTINTIYEEKHTTEFRFVKDSLIIYGAFFKNLFVAVTSAIIDIVLFAVFHKFISKIIFATIFARIISGLYNFTLNKLWTFNNKDKKNLPIQSGKYLVLFLVQMYMSGFMTSILDKLFGAWLGIIFIKIIVDCVIFFVNFFIQKKWIFN